MYNDYSELPELSAVTLPTGRTYQTPTGRYPSITTILGKTGDNTWLERWKAAVGEEEAARRRKNIQDPNQPQKTGGEKPTNVRTEEMDLQEVKEY